MILAVVVVFCLNSYEIKTVHQISPRECNCFSLKTKQAEKLEQVHVYNQFCSLHISPGTPIKVHCIARWVGYPVTPYEVGIWTELVYNYYATKISWYKLYRDADISAHINQ